MKTALSIALYLPVMAAIIILATVASPFHAFQQSKRLANGILEKTKRQPAKNQDQAVQVPS